MHQNYSITSSNEPCSSNTQLSCIESLSNLSLYDTVDDQVEDDDYYDPELCFENENDEKVVKEHEEEESIKPKKKLTVTSMANYSL
ncbi:hypothetical protein BpHYR1_054433 [Brachionus plicatilis]|uniref:Uncharacterized protein n=1 Tax=Brachionus plicatilis TaxID=10195 RepID=A0A3M7QI21_BRAPC|nr:hypothetical protein BpHYR1_054433 [Brachionus plicatilis]